MDVLRPGVRRKVEAGLRRRLKRTAAGASAEEAAPATPLPRPERLRLAWTGNALPPQRNVEIFPAGIVRTGGRLCVWVYAALRFAAGTLLDALRHRNTQQARAVRLREILQGLGATFIKVGQQLSLRIDLFPYAYGQELEKLLDRLPVMPIAPAVRAIEAAAGGRPLREVYAYFDPIPIGSASLACVYQALLPSGEKVAIKVRRPGVGETLAADLRALGWLLRLLELFFVEPGMSKNLLHDLRTTLFAELDFAQEARFNELFRRGAGKTFRWVTAPRIYFDLGNRSVMVAELVSGVFLTDLLAAVEAQDCEALAALAERGIHPKTVSRRLARVNRYSGFEGLFFHADLHPANVVVRPKSRLTLIDFGSCGAFTEAERVLWFRIFQAQYYGDVGSMAKAAIALLEPLPPIDIDAFTNRVEALFWQELYAVRSKHSPWWERTTANLWIGFLKLAGEFALPVPLNMLRLIRVTLLVDTVAARLNPKFDHYREFYGYLEGAGKRAKKRLFYRVRRFFSYPAFYRIERLFTSGSKLIYRLERFADAQPLRLLAMLGKAAYGVTMVLTTILRTAPVAIVVVLAVAAWRKLRHQTPAAPVAVAWDLVTWLLGNGWIQALLVVILLIMLRRYAKRADDPDQ